MKRLALIIIALTAIILTHPNKTYASIYEQPIAGVAQVLSVATEHPTDYAIAYYSATNHLDSDLVYALIDGESDGDKNAVNHNDNGTHDSGLMQINSCNHEWLSDELGITDFYDPIQNIEAGCYILGLLSKKYDDVHRVLMCYNMGETQTRKLWNQGIRSSRYSRGIVDKLNKIKEG